jgi:anti-sigma regulatory factor (Ser/Thr protein kinase)
VTQPVRRRFPGRRDQVSCARAFVKDVLRGCPQLDEAVLLTSELCTNALQHSQSGNGGTFEVTVYHRPGSLRIEVRDDGSASTPVLQSFDSCSEDGRGLEIVECLAHRWGQRGDEYGRCVYFELRWNHPAHSHDPA